MDRRSDSTFSLSSLASTWWVPPKLSHQDSTSQRLWPIHARLRLWDSELSIDASNWIQWGPLGRERELRNRNIFVQVVAL